MKNKLRTHCLKALDEKRELQLVTRPSKQRVSSEPHKDNVLISVSSVYSHPPLISVSRCSRMQGVLPVCGLQPLLALLLLQTVGCGKSSLKCRQSPSPDLQCIQYIAADNHVHKKTFDQSVISYQSK